MAFLASSNEFEIDLVQIEIAHGSRDRLVLRLLQRLFEPAREGIIPALLSRDRLLEERLASSRFRFEYPRRIVQLRPVAALGHRVTDYATKVQVDHEDSIAAGTSNLELALKLRHRVILRNAHSELQC